MGYSNFGRIKTIVLPIEIPTIPENATEAGITIRSDEYFTKYGIDLLTALAGVTPDGFIKKINERSLIYLYFNKNDGSLKNPLINVIIPQYELIQNSLSDDGVTLSLLKKTYLNEYSGDSFDLRVEYNAETSDITNLYIHISLSE